jgi:hypothetical protein
VHVVWTRRLRYVRGGVDWWIGSTLLFVQVVLRPENPMVSVGEGESVGHCKVEVVGGGVGRLYWVSRTNWGRDRSDAAPWGYEPSGCGGVQRHKPASDRMRERAILQPGPGSR